MPSIWQSDLEGGGGGAITPEGVEVPMKRWCIYIDILGFSQFWECDECQALHSLRELMRTIYRIGVKAYPEEPQRLFAHQMGDGFAIVGEFGEESLERPIAIAIALMRCVAATGTLAVSAIAEGDHADITGCYPREVTDSSESGIVRLGMGFMTLSKVMGTAFIRAYRLHGDAPSGPFLAVSANHRDRIPDGLTVRSTESRKGTSLLSIDWVRAELALLSDIQHRAGIDTPSPCELVQRIQGYCNQYECIRDKWSCCLRGLLDIEV